MDTSDYVLIDTYYQYRNTDISGDLVLGFDVDHRITNFSMLNDDYTYDTNSTDARYVPGIMLKESHTYLVREIATVKHDRFVLQMYVNNTTIYINIKAIYNGVDFMIATICGEDRNIYAVRYIDIVLMIHKILTSTSLGIYSYKYESENILSSILPIKYVPITSTYVNMLNSIATAAATSDPVSINYKHDGQAMWLYISPTMPASLLYQVKVRNGIAHKYIGRVADLPDTTLTCYHCLLIERVDHDTHHEYIVIDAFTEIDEQYIDRMYHAIQVFNKYLIQDTPYTIMIKYKFTEFNIMPTSIISLPITSTSTIPIGTIATPINVMMSRALEHMDGYVIYIGSNRPLKVKLANMVTLDVEYNKSLSAWNYQGQLPVPLETPSTDILMSTNDNIIVMEVNIHTGHIVRVRGDRMRGNSKVVLDNILRSYGEDIKYSNGDVWSGNDIKFSLLINRTFKRFMHLKYMPRRTNLLDVGSGNGGDISIWRDMSYKVLALEKDEGRFNVLCKRITHDISIIAVHDDMRNMVYHLKQSPIRYHSVSFMRSLSMLNDEEIVTMLSGLRAYGCNRILIVTMITDRLMHHSYKTPDQEFNIVYDGSNIVTVSYKSDNMIISYTDNCYSQDKWISMCSSSGYNVVIESQASFVKNAFSLECCPSTYPCFTDIGIFLST
jgi:hypothetical protein